MNFASQSKDLIFGSVHLGESCEGMANHSHERRVRKADPFLLNYNAADLKIASEFLSNWLPFLSRGLCRHCTRTLSDRVRSLDTENHVNGSTKHEDTRPSSSTNTVVNGYSKHVDTRPSSSTNTVVNGSSKHEDTRPSSSTNMVVNGSSKHEDTRPSSSTNMVVNGSSKHEDTRLSSSTNMAVNGFAEGHDDCDTNSLGSWNDSRDVNDTADTNSIGSWKDSADGCSQLSIDTDLQVATRKKQSLVPGSVKSPMVRMSWADMAQEDELEAEDESNGPYSEENNAAGDTSSKEIKPKSQLSREQRELIRFNNVQRKKDFICLEHVNGKLVNILDGLELHAGVFSAAEQKRIVQYVEELREKGQNGQLKERTYTAPQKWMKGKGRVTIQFGCCYNYAMDRNGNPPGILKNGLVDPIPHLLKVMIKRMVSWHVLPPTCVPDSCIINIYEEGDCIPPHIDNLEFVRPFCTVSFLSECNIVFGSNLKIIGPGEFTGAYAIPLPLGSVLVLNGNGADVAKHCVPAVPTKRISITFRRMDESKRPNGYVPEPELQGLQPLSFEADSFKESNSPKPSVRFTRKQPVKREVREESNTGKVRGGYTNRSSESRQFSRVQQQPGNWRRV